MCVIRTRTHIHVHTRVYSHTHIHTHTHTRLIIIIYDYVYCATYIQAGQDLHVPLWYRAPLDHPRNIGDKAIDTET